MGSSVLVVHGRRDATHDVPSGHPDQPDRLDAVARGVAAVAGHHPVTEAWGRLATVAELERVHTPAHVERVAQIERAGGGPLGDDETFVSDHSYEAARAAAGAGLTAVERLAADDANHDPPAAAFVVTRPAGHHATAARAGGFCLFNNVAVATAHLVATGARVTVLDWDAHHGNGTQEIFHADDRVQYVSLHQEAIYPGTGLAHEGGPLAGTATVVNLPLPAGATGDRYLVLLDELVAPVVRRFAPDWVLVSCGFDAHRADPHTDLGLGADDFALLTARAMAMTPRRGRLVLFLEGGYDLEALEASTAAVVATLAGAPTDDRTPSCGGPGAARVTELRRLWS